MLACLQIKKKKSAGKTFSVITYVCTKTHAHTHISTFPRANVPWSMEREDFLLCVK